MTVRPQWNDLYALAESQAGYFTTQQAGEVGYSSQLLLKHLHAGRIERSLRGVYRLVHFPRTEREELVPLWLWTERKGVFSHETALELQSLSDVLPAKAHLTLPSKWKTRRLRVPPDVSLHFADVSASDRTWHGPTPVTNATRTLNDCARSGLSPEFLVQATSQALARGLTTRKDLASVAKALAPFGGIPRDESDLRDTRSVSSRTRGPSAKASVRTRAQPKAPARRL